MAKHVKKSSALKPVLLTVFGLVLLSAIIAVLLRGKDIILLNPKGFVANEQLRLLITSTLILLEICIPVLLLFYYMAWKYRESNDSSHDPNMTFGRSFSIAIWSFPIITALLITAVLVPATFKLQPQKPIENAGKPLVIQVVAMRWKWLFIYPEQNVATVNYVQIPKDTPVQFELTADETPMSSFWIPHLGGMLYAMTEHVNRLNLIADTVGDYEGSAAEINGNGFADMRFTTRVSTHEDFDVWVTAAQNSPLTLTSDEYSNLLTPTEDHAVAVYANPSPNIYTNVLSKYAGGHQHGTKPAAHEGAH